MSHFHTLTVLFGTLICCLGLVNATCAEAQESGRSADATILAAIEKSLPYIQKQGRYWINEKKCVSCHRITFMNWSLSAARENGIKVDNELLTKDIRWMESDFFKDHEDGKSKVGERNLDGISQLLIASRHYDDLLPESEKGLIKFLVDGQNKDGSWRGFGQLPNQKRPKKETNQVATMWNAIALATVDRKLYKPNIEKAISSIDFSRQPKSTEWLATSLMLANMQLSEKLAEESNAISKRLLNHQDDKGGFAWLIGDESDALATATVLFALQFSNESPNQNTKQAVDAATSFLIDTQEKDGSWNVRGTKTATRDSIEETASYWGTTWSVIALSKVLESRK